VNDYLKRANFGERKQSELQVTSLQAILPCVDVLLNVDPGNSSNRAAARNLLETAAIPSLDRAPRILCNGDGAFLAVPRLGESDSLKCADNHKSTADNSWLLYLFSKMSNEKFNLYPSEAS
jgi:hypothetical protein